MKYFNNLRIFGNPLIQQIMYRKPTFNEVYQSIMAKMSNNIISESVYRSETFQELYEDILTKNTQIQLFTTEDLKQYFPIKSKVFKILSKNKNQNNLKLYVICDTYSSKENVKNILTNICSDDKFDDEDVELIYYKFKHAFAMFSMLNNSKEFAMLWIKPNNNINEFIHEFIHYLEFINGFYGHDISLEEDSMLFEEENKFKTIFNLTDEDLQYIFNKAEYQTLLTDFLNKLEKIKQKYFNDLTDFQFARKNVFHLLRDKKETVNDYLNKVKLFEYFDELNIEYDFAMIVGYNCLNFKIMNIKTHIFGKFGNKR